MLTLTSIEMAQEFIEQHPLSFVYVSRTNCSVCHALLPQIEELLKEFPKIEVGFINADDVEEVAGHFSIFTVPAMMLFVDGKEMIREARFVHMEELRKKISKIYGMV
ncbi:thiol reductase thioredoxin [Sutcliffiella cohnii]|uniref:Thiol reductase thioredoxin n=1 Tax=Sutcliffiella cohnii TaxID=33932 RepID=A0A223KWB3_9BACI|nr:thioredoxin family protein [Sutcliffiella cohnii]AST93664.1 thiol reductase thioredoxin [Sutcliffiella cohnii]